MHDSRPDHSLGILLAALLAVTLSLSGCQTVPEPAPAAPAQAYGPPEVDPRLAPLLHAAQAALDAGRFLNPPDDCAVTYFKNMLDIDPGNPAAERGIETIVERYLEDARDAADRHRWESARAMLDLAQIVDPHHPVVAPMRAQIEMLAAAKRLVLNLRDEAVRKQTHEASRKLAELGVHARGPDVRVMIRAGSDAQGRWMYEQLNRAPGDARIRAAMEIGRPPRVVVLLLPEPTSEAQ